MSSEPEILPVLAGFGTPSAEYRRQIAELKRFAERYSMDAAFRSAVARSGQAALSRLSLEVDSEEIRPLWDTAASQALRVDEAAGRLGDYPLPVRRFRAYQRERQDLRRLARQAVQPRHPRMAAWHQRQVRRCQLELGERKADDILHAPVAFELARGCSVGCWFCGLGAGRLEAVWPYAENRALWRGCLEVVRDVLGPGAASGFCYWATEPLDNPDYEEFCGDFERILGRFPPTTTAVPMRDVERTRRLCAQSATPVLGLDRFSIVSVKVLDQVHAAFSPTELLRVELVPVTPQSLLPKVRAGGARLVPARPGLGPVEEVSAATTIACVSGFLLNMPEKRVRLITPCRAGERWPLGYRVHGERTFGSPSSLRRALAELIEGGMTADLQLDRIVAFASGVTWREDDGLQVRGRHRPALARGLLPGSERIARRAARADLTAADIALAEEAEDGAPLAETLARLDRMFQLGLLDDAPAVDRSGESPA